ncbi:MAG: GNAT family N-acetyltransferase [Solobacterium sp.]|nr:GNAT family N-acetyltransferase [Solobacterium sp.]
MIVKAEDRQFKADTARRILEDLPEWFGIESAREQYIRNTADEVMFVSDGKDGPEGFLCLKETGRDTAEISVMGVRKECQGQRIGTQLFEAAYRYAKETGYSFLQVKTVKSGCYPEYDQTNCFYRSLGFKEFEIIETLWDEANPAQIYVMHIS